MQLEQNQTNSNVIYNFKLLSQFSQPMCFYKVVPFILLLFTVIRNAHARAMINKPSEKECPFERQ